MVAEAPAILAVVQTAESQASVTPRGATHPSGARRIEASRWLVPVDVGELWRYRELVGFFVLRDAKSRYRQTFFGPAWAILRPLVQIVVFTVIFSHLAHISPGPNVHIPYALWVTPGVLAFGYVASALSSTSTSLVTNSQIITKVYFPRVYIPVSTAITPVIDFALGFVVLLGLFGYYHRTPSWRIVFVPAFLALAAIIVVGVGLWMSSFTARYRDVVFGVPFLVQIWQYATPVIYPVSFIPSRFQWLLDLNPFTAVVNGFRWSVLGLSFGSPVALAVSLGMAVGVAASGLVVFRRTERLMVDML